MKSAIALAGAAVLLFAPVAHAANPAVEAPVHQFLDGFNKGDVKSAKAAHVAAPSISDEIAPHHWSGPAAFDTWVADLTKSEAAEGKSGGQVTLGKVSREVISGAHAYVIVPATYTFQQKGKTMHEVSQMTFVLAKMPTGWKIQAWTWTGPEASPVK